MSNQKKSRGQYPAALLHLTHVRLFLLNTNARTTGSVKSLSCLWSPCCARVWMHDKALVPSYGALTARSGLVNYHSTTYKK